MLILAPNFPRFFPVDRRHEGARTRKRRHKSTIPRFNAREIPSAGSLVLQYLGQTQGGRGLKQEVLNKNSSDKIICLCCNCFEFLLEYDERTAVLTFSYNLRRNCDADCSRK